MADDKIIYWAFILTLPISIKLFIDAILEGKEWFTQLMFILGGFSSIKLLMDKRREERLFKTNWSEIKSMILWYDGIQR